VAAEEKAALAITALADRRATDPVVLDMRDVTIVTDYFLICHGTSKVHIRGLADAVAEALAKESLRPYGVEGYEEAEWILLDYGDVILHIFSEEQRAFYDLERLWSDAPRVTADPPVESSDHV
jgi:ribosome-associated protein